MNTFISLFSVVIVVKSASAVYSSTTDKNLRNDKFNTSVYDRVSRPNGTTTVKASLSLLSINDLELKTQKFSCIGWLTLGWTDERLTWAPANYDDIHYTYAVETEIWKPEVIVDNSVVDVGVIHDSELLFRVKYTGDVHWEPPQIFDVHCNVDITFYPFDEQNCDIQVVTWAQPVEEIRLEHDKTEVNLEDYSEHGEWIIERSEVQEKELEEHFEDGSVERFSLLEFHLILKRRPTFYVLNTVLPVNVCSLLLVIVFILPVESGEKVSFALTVLLTLAVLLTLIADHMPSTSLHTSVLGLYLAVTLILAGFTVLSTVLAILMFHRTDDVNQESIFIKSTRNVAKVLNWKTMKQKHEEEKERKLSNSKVIPVKHGDVVSTDEETDGEKMDLTWMDVSMIWDRLFFFVFLMTSLFSTAVFMIALSVGGENTHK